LRQQLAKAEHVFEDAGQHPLLKEVIDAEDIAAVVADWTGIPISRMLESEREKLLAMESRLTQRVIGQAQAIKALAEAVRRSRSGLSDPNRPIGSFLFLGPTGVGKTELAKALAIFLFDDERAMIRLDMSEFMEKHNASRLVGPPPGYVGHEEGGQLTEAVRQRPYSVILFDEVEKAHQDVFNLLLQLLDDGRLTDSHGRTVDFKNTVVIMTSNIGASAILEERIGQNPESIRTEIMTQLRDHFRPEFLNRIDDILIFERLSFDAIKLIAEIQFSRLRQLLQERGLDIEFTDAAKQFIAKAGYDPAFGARPLRRAILNLVQNPLSMQILEGRFAEQSTILTDVVDNRLVFTHKGSN
jgi:ATP-dependent Clp protease ATP-binding subunit ClpB